MSPTDTDLEARLRQDLRARQDDVPPAPADLADRVRRRHRSQRRTQALTVVAAAAVIAVFAGASGLVPAPPPGGTSDAAEAAPPSRTPAYEDWPVRGSLAGDDAWLDAVRRLDWEVPPELAADIPEPSIPDRQVLFAGDVPGARVALVVGEDDGRWASTWFTGAPGADPAGMGQAEIPLPITDRQPLALVTADSEHSQDGVLVVVAAPGWTFDLTEPAVVDADGRETQDRRQLPVEAGVSVSRLRAPMSMHTELRAREDGRMPYRMGVTGAYRDEAARAARAALADAPGLTDAQILDDAIADALARYGLPAEVARPAVLARGAGSGEERVVLFGFTFTSGATAAWLLQHESMPDGGYQSTLGRLPHAPAGTALADRLIGVPVDGYRIAVHAPAAASGVEVLTADGRVLGLLPLTDGGHVGEVPGGAFVPSTDGAASLRAVDASGATVAEAPIGRVGAG